MNFEKIKEFNTEFAYDSQRRLITVTQDQDTSGDGGVVTNYAYIDTDTAAFTGFEQYFTRITDGAGKQTYIAMSAFGKRAKTLYPSGDWAGEIKGEIKGVRYLFCLGLDF